MAETLTVIWSIGVRTAALGVVLALVVTVAGLGLAVRDKEDFEGTRQARVQSLTGERTTVQAELGGVHQRMARITTEIAAEQVRIRQTEGVIGQLKALDNTWDKLTGDVQQKANTERREKLEKELAESRVKVPAMEADYRRTGWERDGLEIELGKLEARVKQEEEKSKVGYYLGEAWNWRVGGMNVKGWVGVVLGLFVGLMVVWRAVVEGKGERLGGLR